MCGIIGYIGNENATKILLEGLSRLEYRGYDSAGFATIYKGDFQVKKSLGRVDNLKLLEAGYPTLGNIGIAHTRWATHGKPSIANAHPHLDVKKSFAVVHNGIIENYWDLKDFLGTKGYCFSSSTDTEVIPNLIHYYYSILSPQTRNGFLVAVRKAINCLKGSYALAIISNLYPGEIIVTRKNSPLIIGTADGCNYVASDISAIIKYTSNFYFLDDNDIAIISKDSVSFVDNDLCYQNKSIQHIEWNAVSADKFGYEDYMLKEICEQPVSIRGTIGKLLPFNMPCNFSKNVIPIEILKNVKKIYIVACGTAMHAGLVARDFFEKLCGIMTVVEIASEFRYREPLLDDQTLCIFVSQSGETADTLAALRLANSKNAYTIAITNVMNSSITHEANHTLYTHAGPEIAVASTKAYTSQIVLLSILSLHLAELLGSCDANRIAGIKSALLDLPTKIETILSNKNVIKDFADSVYKERDMYFIGRGMDYCTALEASLKLKEISYIHSDAYAAGELKHGPIALIEKDITVIGIATCKSLIEKTISNLEEVVSRGAKTLVITNQDLSAYRIENVIRIPDTHELLSPILSIIPLQLFSYYISKEKGLDVDKPRNLAKSVTVE